LRKIINRLSSGQVTARSPRRRRHPPIHPLTKVPWLCSLHRSTLSLAGCRPAWPLRSVRCSEPNAPSLHCLVRRRAERPLIRRSHVERPGLRYRPGPFSLSSTFCRQPRGELHEDHCQHPQTAQSTRRTSALSACGPASAGRRFDAPTSRPLTAARA